MTQIITLAGRKFKQITHATLEHDYKVLALLNAAGIRSIEMPEDADPQIFMEQLFANLVLAGSLLALFSHLVLPVELEGKDWKPSVAADIEAHLRSLTDESDKATVHEQLVAMLIGFFQNGLVRLVITPSFSGQTSL